VTGVNNIASSLCGEKGQTTLKEHSQKTFHF